MNIAVYVNGLSDGFNTPGGTEAQYIYALVKMLAKNGHKIYCYGDNPEWGNDTPLSNVTLLDYWTTQSINYDLYINLPHGNRNAPCTQTHIKAKQYAHCQFSWHDESYLKIPVNCWKEPYNHLIFIPWHIPQNTTSDAIRYVPFPYYDELPELQDPQERRSIFWAARNPFGDEHHDDNQPMTVQGTKVMKALDMLSKSDPQITVYFFNARNFRSNRAKRLGVQDIINYHPNRIVYEDLVPKSIIINALKRSCLALIPPDQMAYCVDAAIYGCLPLFFKTQPPFDNYCAEGFHYIRNMLETPNDLTFNYNDTVASIYIKICRGLTISDGSLAQWTIKESGQGMEWHSYENSHKEFLKAIQ